MLSDKNQQKQFTTLIACEENPTFQLDTTDIVLIYVHTHNETASAISNRLFNLILIDLDINEFGLLGLAKSFDCINSDTPTIAIADALELDQRRHLISSGFDDCLIKPLEANQLIELIDFWRNSSSLTPYIESVQILLSKTKNNTGLINRLYNKLFEELPLQISNIEMAIKNREYKVAFEVTHQLNGSAKTCYLQEMAEIANSLEMCLIQNNFEFADGFFSMLKQNVSTFIKHRKPILEFLNNEQ
jgi:two-component system, NarL family, sensor histidine kinase BarA